jgi:hypothetical protein
MRNHLSLFFLFSLLSITTLFTACQKEENLTTDDSQQLTFRDPQSFTYSLDSAGVGDSVLITFDAGNGADCGFIHIQVSADGEDWSGGKPIVPESGLASFLFLPEEPGTYAVRAKYIRTGKPSECDFENTKWLVSPDSIIVAGDTTSQDTTATDSCESYFAGEVINCDSSNHEVVYTFVADEDLDHLKIQGGLTNGVQGDPTVAVTGADLDVTIKTPGHSSNRVITLQGSAVACDTITVTLTWVSNNNGSYITGEWSAYGLEVAELECE